MGQPEVRQQAGPQTIRKLASLVADLKQSLAVQKRAGEIVDGIKREIKELTSRYALPVQEERSEYLSVPAAEATLRVTRSAPAPTLNPTRLLAEVGREVFLDVVIVQKVELNLEGWRAALAAERVTTGQLERSLDQPQSTVTVALGGLR